MDVIANKIHHAAMLQLKGKVTLRRVVVRLLIWAEFMDFFRENDTEPKPYPIEGIGIFTLMVMALWVDVLAAAPMVNVSRKSKILTMRVLEF